MRSGPAAEKRGSRGERTEAWKDSLLYFNHMSCFGEKKKILCLMSTPRCCRKIAQFYVVFSETWIFHNFSIFVSSDEELFVSSEFERRSATIHYFSSHLNFGNGIKFSTFPKKFQTLFLQNSTLIFTWQCVRLIYNHLVSLQLKTWLPFYTYPIKLQTGTTWAHVDLHSPT